jgi:hypothetical protein
VACVDSLRGARGVFSGITSSKDTPISFTIVPAVRIIVYFLIF